MDIQQRKELLENILDMNLSEFKTFITDYCDFSEPLENILDFDVLNDEGIEEVEIVELFSLSDIAKAVEAIENTYTLPKKYVEIYDNLEYAPQLIDLDELEVIYETKGEKELTKVLSALVLLNIGKRSFVKLEEEFDKLVSSSLNE